MKMKVIAKLLTLLAAIGLSASLTACDEIKQAVDRESEELRQNIADKEESFRPLAGEYRGTLTHENATSQRSVILVLIPTTIIVQNPGRNDISQVPSLGGSLSVILESFLDGEENLIPIAHYDSAVWDPRSSQLRLNGTLQSASAGPIHVFLEGSVQGDRIIGRAHSSLKGFVGALDVKRVALDSGTGSETTH